MPVTPQLPAAVLWDMDGTIVDTEPLWVEAQNALLVDHGLPALSPAQEELLVGAAWPRAAELFASLGLRLDERRMRADVTGRVLHGMRGGLRWRPGARELLAELREFGVPAALVTNSTSEMARTVVEQLPPGTIATIVSIDDVGDGKPHPEPYRLAAARLGVPAGRCVAIEDSATGLASAVAAGCAAIGVPHGMSLPEREDYLLLPGLDGVSAGFLGEFLHGRAAARGGGRGSRA